MALSSSLGSGIIDPEFGDVEFVLVNVEKGERDHLYAHKDILSKRCDYFGARIQFHNLFLMIGFSREWSGMDATGSDLSRPGVDCLTRNRIRTMSGGKPLEEMGRRSSVMDNTVRNTAETIINHDQPRARMRVQIDDFDYT